MKKIRIDEQVSVWRYVEIEVPDEIKDYDSLMEYVDKNGCFSAKILGTYEETEEFITYDREKMEIVDE